MNYYFMHRYLSLVGLALIALCLTGLMVGSLILKRTIHVEVGSMLPGQVGLYNLGFATKEYAIKVYSGSPGSLDVMVCRGSEWLTLKPGDEAVVRCNGVCAVVLAIRSYTVYKGGVIGEIELRPSRSYTALNLLIGVLGGILVTLSLYARRLEERRMGSIQSSPR